MSCVNIQAVEQGCRGHDLGSARQTQGGVWQVFQASAMYSCPNSRLRCLEGKLWHPISVALSLDLASTQALCGEIVIFTDGR